MLHKWVRSPPPLPPHITAAELSPCRLLSYSPCWLFRQWDRSPLHIAAERGNTAIVELLIDRCHANISARTKDGSTLMHIASQHGHPDTALAFLRKGVMMQMPNKVGATPGAMLTNPGETSTTPGSTSPTPGGNVNHPRVNVNHPRDILKNYCNVINI